jgi:hypothetical protein
VADPAVEEELPGSQNTCIAQDLQVNRHQESLLVQEADDGMVLDGGSNTQSSLPQSSSIDNELPADPIHHSLSESIEMKETLQKSNHLANSWYIQVVGRTGVYVNNFYHGCVSSTSDAKMVPVKSGDQIRIGEWQGSLYFV